MPNVEDRIVQMRFDNKQFEKGAKESLNTLNKLDSALRIQQGLEGLTGMETAIDKIANRFSVMGIVGMTAIQNITSAVLHLGKTMLTAIPNQIISGGSQRALNIANARFQLEGLGVEWKEIYEDIDYGVKDTAYGFDSAAKAAAQLSASSVKTGDNMKTALRGISGVAAMTNSSYDEIADVFISAAGVGRVTGDTLQRLAYRGLNAAAILGEAMGKSEAEVRKLVSSGKISFTEFARIMDEALGPHAKDANQTFQGSLANMKAALSRIGADFATPYYENMTKIQNAFRVMFNNIRKITQPFAESTFTRTIGRIADTIVRIIEKIDISWVSVLVDGFGVMIHWAEKLASGLEKIVDWFRELFVIKKYVFTNDEGEESQFIDREAQARVEKFMNILRGLVAIMRTVGDVFKNVWRRIAKLGPGLSNIGSKILNVASNWGVWLDKSRKMFTLTAAVNKAFTQLDRIISPIARIIGAVFSTVIDIITDLFDLFKKDAPEAGNSVKSAFGTVYDAIVNILEKIADFTEKVRDFVKENKTLSSILHGIGSIVRHLYTFFTSAASGVNSFIRSLLGVQEGETILDAAARKVGAAWERVKGVFSSFKEQLSSVLGSNGLGTDIIKIVGGIAAAFFGYRKLDRDIIPVFRRLKKGFSTWYDWVALPEKINIVASKVIGFFNAQMDNINAKTLKEIGLALLILAGALLVLSLIDMDTLTNNIKILAGLFVMLLASLRVMQNAIPSFKKMFGMAALTAAIVGIGAAAMLLALALVVISQIPFEKLKNGLAGLSFGLAAMVTALVVLADYGPVVISGATALLILSVGLIALSVAVGILSLIPFDKMLNALAALAGALLIMVTALSVLAELGPVVLASAGALLILSSGLVVLAVAMLIVSMIPFDRMMDGLIGLGAGLAAMTVALIVLGDMGPDVLIGAAALLVLTAAIAAFAIVLMAISLIPTDKMLDSMTIVIFGLAAMAIVLFALSGVAPMAAAAAGAILILSIALAASAVAFVILAIGLRLMEGLHIGKIALQLLALVIPLMLLGVAGLIFGIGGPGLLLGAAGLVVLAIAFNMLEGLHIGKMALQLVALVVPLMLIGIAGIIFGLGGIGLALGGSGLMVVALALGMFQGMSIDFGGLIKLSVALLLLGVAGILLIPGGIGLLIGSIGLMALAGALPLLSAGLRSMEAISWDTIAVAFAALAGSVAVLLGLEFATLRDGTGALINLANAMPEIASGLSSMADLDASSMETAFDAIKRSVGSLFKLQFATFSDGTAQLKSLAEAMPGIADGLNKLSTLDANGIKTSFDALKKSVNTLLKLEFADSANTTELLYGLGTAFPVFAAGVSALANLDSGSLSVTFGAVATSVNLLGGIDSTSLLVTIAALTSFGAAVINISAGLRGIPENGGEKLAQALTIESVDIGAGIIEALNAVSLAIDSASSSIITLGTAIVRNLASGILSGVNNITSAMATVSVRIKNAASNIATSMPTYGKQIARGIANGLYSSTGIVVAAMYDMAYRMKEELKRVWGINSPSRVAAEIAHGIPEGIVKGLDAGTPMAKNALDDMADEIIETLYPALSVIDDMVNDKVNMEPSIRPVINTASLNDALYSGGLTPFGVSSTVSHRIDGITAEAMSNNRNYTNDLQQLIAINRELLESSKAGGSVYLNDGVIAGMVNRRLGVL